MSSRAVLFLDTAMPFETESDVIWCHRKQKLLRFKAIDCLLKSFLPFDTRIRSEQKKSLGTYVKGERNCNWCQRSMPVGCTYVRTYWSEVTSRVPFDKNYSPMICQCGSHPEWHEHGNRRKTNVEHVTQIYVCKHLASPGFKRGLIYCCSGS